MTPSRSRQDLSQNLSQNLSQDLSQAASAASGAAEPMAQTVGGSQSPATPRYACDAGLLFRCMDMLQIDRQELAGYDPLTFRELQGICTLCRSKQECVEDLAGEFADVNWGRWWMYCPNAAMLTLIGAMQKCGRAAPQTQTAQLALPSLDAVSHLR